MGYPVSAPQRWAHHDRASCRDRHSRAVFDSLPVFCTHEGHAVNQISWNASGPYGKRNQYSRGQSYGRVGIFTFGNDRIPFVRPLQTVPLQNQSIICEQTTAGITIQDLYAA